MPEDYLVPPLTNTNDILATSVPFEGELTLTKAKFKRLLTKLYKGYSVPSMPAMSIMGTSLTPQGLAAIEVWVLPGKVALYSRHLLTSPRMISVSLCNFPSSKEGDATSS